MTSQELGSSFEIITKDFFVWLIEKIGFVVTKSRVQKSGTQNGFDILLMVSKNYDESKIFIECKNYETDLSIGNILKKGLNLESNYELDENDLFIAINPKSIFSNEDNSEKLSPILDNKFKFSYYSLDVSNGVKELFALNNNFYKQIYFCDVDFKVDKDKEIKRFENIIFSRNPYKKVIIEENDKFFFIGNIELEEDFIVRSFSEKHNIEKAYLWIDNQKDDLTLSKILETENKIFVLGNPGTGKTTELINLALSSWKIGENDGYVPIFKSLKDFTNTDSLETYLPKKWTKLNKVLLIFDGIDEIADIEYFISKLNSFLRNDLKKRFKLVISCRTNIYETIVKDISGFKKFYLNDLSRQQSLDFLKTKCNAYETLNLNQVIYDFLKTPFQVKILVDYINKNNNLPINTYEIWETYIENRLTHDKNDKLKKVKLSVPLIKKFSKKMSVINELMKKSIISESELFTVVNENNNDFNEFIKNPLIEKQLNFDNYFFYHKNIQEFFAADLISNRSIEEIKDFILIRGTNKTHPSLFNTITFLINISDIEKCNSLIQWFVENEPELLFKADKNRIETHRVKVFQEYFYNQCIIKTYWINNDKTFSVKEIAEFGNCNENFDYLYSIIIDKKSHFRAIISALDLLSFFKIPLNKIDKLKKDFLDLLADTKISNDIKANILNCIENQKFIETDKEYLNSIFEIFKEETDKEINSALLSILKDYELIDNLFWYINEEFLRENKIKPRHIDDKVMRGNKWKLESIIIRFQDSNNFIALAKYYFDETKIDYGDSVFSKSLIERCLFFEAIEDDFIIRLLSSIEEDVRFYLREDLLKNLILESKLSSQLSAFNYLIDNFTFNNVGYFLASITNSETIGIVVDKFIDGTLEREKLDFFRNVIANHGNRELAEIFNDEMIKNGFNFNEPFNSNEKHQELINKQQAKPQENFDLLFNKPKLLDEIEKIFMEYSNSIKPEIMKDIDMEWYEKKSHGNIIDIQYSLLSRLVYQKKKEVSFEDIRNILNDEFIIIKEIYSKIKGQKERENKFTVKEYQIDYLREWCILTSEKICFDDIIQVIDANRFRLGNDYELLRVILYFNSKFNFDLSQDFLLNSIIFFDVDLSNIEDNNLETLKLKIKDDKKFNQRILDNLLNEKLASFSLNKHIQYVIDSRLSKAYFKVREFFLIDDYNVNDKMLRDYIDITNDYLLLKELCLDVRSHSCWSSIKILMDLGIEVEFCSEKAVEYLNSDIEDEKNYYYSNALSVLFQNNSIEALRYIQNFIDLEKSPSLNNNSYVSYSVIEDYNILETLFNKIYLGDMDKIGYSGLTYFLEKYISNLSNTKEGYNETMSVLKRIKEKLEKTSQENGLFYINILIDNSDKSYINSQSKALTFAEALSKVEEILY